MGCKSEKWGVRLVVLLESRSFFVFIAEHSKKKKGVANNFSTKESAKGKKHLLSESRSNCDVSPAFSFSPFLLVFL